MTEEIVLRRDRAGRLWLSESAPNASGPGPFVMVIAMAEACRRVGKSRRQLYRYIRSGRLRPRAKVLDQWVFEAAEVSRIRGGRPLPATLRPLFPEYAVASLDPTGDAELIIERVMDLGDLTQVRWLRRRYDDARLCLALRRRGWRLSPRSRRFWEVLLSTRAAAAPRWRRVGLALGGVA